MQRWEQFYQLPPESFIAYNEAPTYLSGRVIPTDSDGLQIVGHAIEQNLDWYNMGGKTRGLRAHSFAFTLDATPRQPVGA